ncbi:hypothetical protein CLSA_c03440 [Clostridium saccharobutylicum DSM 13864]|uniref:Uncharacterized protein n=2 Tax=Clostridium saccharobutylicum TaxID=169679 RepID=U5MKU8_CLOSA|nr:hypothetical protein CLSA_c03440 [Clostridium saccharobutylicum DSM 13864]
MNYKEFVNAIMLIDNLCGIYWHLLKINELDWINKRST